MIRVFAIFIFIITLLGCQDVSDIEESFYFVDSIKQEDFIKQLDEQQITYRLTDNGHVWYKIKDKNKVSKIIYDKTIGSYKENAIYITNDEYFQVFINVLNNKVDVEIDETAENTKRIVWKKEDAEIMQQVIKSVHIVWADLQIEKKRKNGQDEFRNPD